MVGEGEKIPDLLRGRLFAFLDAEVLAQHHQAVGPATFMGLVIELRHAFAHQLFVQVAPAAHHGFLDPLGFAPRLGGDLIARQAVQRLPGLGRQGLGQVDHFGMGIQAEEEFEALLVPAIQFAAQAKIGVPAQGDLPGIGPHQGDRPVDPGHAPLVAGDIARLS